MQIKSPGSCNQPSWNCAAMGAALSITLQPPQLPDAVLCVSPDGWTDSTGTRLGTGIRGAAETGANFSPKR